MNNRAPVIIIDIDGTLSNPSAREHHLPDFDSFHSEADRDPPTFLSRFLSRHENLRDFWITLCTGRNERFRSKTVEWLTRHDLPHQELIMRGNSDYRPAPLYKVEAVKSIQARGQEVALFIDNDIRVIEAVRELDIPTMLVRF